MSRRTVARPDLLAAPRHHAARERGASLSQVTCANPDCRRVWVATDDAFGRVPVEQCPTCGGWATMVKRYEEA